MEIEAVKKEVARIVEQELPEGYTAFFFGSRITGTASPRSDLDVGIEGTNGVPLSLQILSNMKERCAALRTLYTVDVVDLTEANEVFRQVAKEKIEPIAKQ